MIALLIFKYLIYKYAVGICLIQLFLLSHISLPSWCQITECLNRKKSINLHFTFLVLFVQNPGESQCCGQWIQLGSTELADHMLVTGYKGCIVN